MFSLFRASSVSRCALRGFSTSSARRYDLAKLTIIGRLGKDPEVRTSKNDKEYVFYTVATTNYPPPPENPDGTRPEAKTSWHNIVSFNANTNNYLKTLEKGTRVYVEADYELREPDTSAEPSSFEGQRQIFLRHSVIRLLGPRPSAKDHSHRFSEPSSGSTSGSTSESTESQTS